MNNFALDTCCERLLNIARGCHDYGGGYGDPREVEIYHHGIQTVINALESAASENTLQVRMLESIGRATPNGGRCA